MWHDISVRVSKLTLLNETFSVQLLGNSHTQLQMFADEIFKLFGPCLLALAIKQDTVVVSHDFINRLPEVLDHFVDVVSFTSEFNLLVSQEFLVFYLALTQLLPAKADVFLSIVLLFLVLTLEVLLHPDHFLKKKVEMSFLGLYSCGLNELFNFLRQNFYLAVRVSLYNIGANLFKHKLVTL